MKFVFFLTILFLVQRNGFSKNLNLDPKYLKNTSESKYFNKNKNADVLQKSISMSAASNSFFSKIFYHSKNKIVILDFWANWCMPCIKMVKILNLISSKHKDKVLLIKVDIDEFKEFSNYVGIKSIPCVWLFSKDSVKKINGFKSEDELEKEVIQMYKKT